MVIFSKISKYVLKSFLVLLLAFLILSVFFLYKPSYFLNNIENYLANSFESYFSDIDVSIETIEGNFFSGFNIENIEFNYSSSAAIFLKHINIKPSLKDIFYGDLIFKSIELDGLKIENISNMSFNDKFISNSNFLIPDIIIKKIIFNNGLVAYNNKDLLFSGNLNVSVENKISQIDIEDFTVSFNNSRYEINKGIISFSREDILLKEFVISDNNNLIGNLSLDLNLFPLSIDNASLNLSELGISVYDDIVLSDIKFSAKKHKNLNYDLDLNLKVANEKKYLNLHGYYENKLLFFTSIDQKIFDNFFDFNGVYDLKKHNGELNIASNENNLIDLSGRMDFNVYDLFDIRAQMLFDSFSYDYFKLKNISGELSYEKNMLKVSKISFYSLDDMKFEVEKGIFESMDNYSFSGKMKGDFFNLSPLNNIFKYDFTNYRSEDLFVSYDYKKDAKDFKMKIDAFSKKIISDDLELKNVRSEIVYSDFIDEFFLSSQNLTFKDYSLDSINFTYSNGNMFFSSKNIASGEFLNFKSNFKGEDIFISYLEGKINNIDIYGEKISLINNGDEYQSRNMDVFIGKGKLYCDLKFQNFTNYTLSIMVDDIDFNAVDKLMFLNNRYNGLLHGNINISNMESELFVKTDLFASNFRFDEFDFLKASFSGFINNNQISIKSFVGSNDLSSFALKGFIELDDDFNFSAHNAVDLNAEIKNISLKKINRYIPWAIDLGGDISSDVLISGTLSDIKFDMHPFILNPQFDKVAADKIFGKVSYKNNRLYFSDIACQTGFGKYDINGSLPANLNYFNTENIDLKPIYVDINGTSTSMEFLLPYFSFIKEFNGQFEYTLNIHGNYLRTIRDGQLTIKNAHLDILQLDNRIININSYAVINNNRLIINDFSAELFNEDDLDSEKLINGITSPFKNVLDYTNKNESTLEILGSMNLESFFNPDFSLSVNGKNNYLSSSYGQFEGIGNSNITITGQDTILISGEFEPRFNQFVLFDIENRNSNSEIQEITDSKFIAYDIYMPFSNGIRIKSDNIDLFLEGEMNLSSFSNNNIKVSGKANIIDGNFFYNGNEFYNTQGTILIDPIIDSPYIELHSTTDIYEDNINVSFIGYTDNPNLILESSSSNYSQSDILQLLTFRDKSLDQSISEPFGNIVTNYLETQLEKNVTFYTDLDEFRLQHTGSLIKGFDDADISVFMGKRISNRLYLNTKINLNDNNLNEYEMSYRLNSNSSIVAKIDDNRYWKLNYRFKYKY